MDLISVIIIEINHCKAESLQEGEVAAWQVPWLPGWLPVPTCSLQKSKTDRLRLRLRLRLYKVLAGTWLLCGFVQRFGAYFVNVL